jgi:GNAT superfamily N-acetyltransferase
LLIRSLRDDDDRSSFRSGHPELDRFLHRYAAQNQFRLHIGTTYVAIDELRDPSEILGFVTVAACSIAISGLPRSSARRLPAYPIPALRVARMAVAESAQRRGIGTHLVRAVFGLAHEQARRVGRAFILVDAKDDAVAFYERFGFEPKPVLAGELDARPANVAMFLELSAIVDPGEAPR